MTVLGNLGHLPPFPRPLYAFIKDMLSTERVKELLGNGHQSDREIEQIRDAFRTLAEIIFDKWLLEKKKTVMTEEGSETCGVNQEAR